MILSAHGALIHGSPGALLYPRSRTALMLYFNTNVGATLDRSAPGIEASSDGRGPPWGELRGERDRLEVPVVGTAFLLAVDRTLGGVHIEHNAV